MDIILMKRIILFLIISVYLVSCNEESSPVNNNNTSNSPYSGLMRTDESGSILEEEDDDWNPICYNIPSFGSNFFCLYPPRGNPGTKKITISLANRLDGNYKITVH